MKNKILKIVAFVLTFSLCLSNTVSAKKKKTKEELEIDNAKKEAIKKITKDKPTGICVSADEIKYQMEAQEKIKPESNSYKGWPKGPLVQADSACLMDYDSGAVLYAKQMEKKEYPASITKIMTALVAIENGDIENDKVTFSEKAVYCVPPGFAHIAMKPKETISLKDSLYGMMLASANEVAYGIGENIGGTHENFIEMMNKKAEELNCPNTHFENTNGIFSENHYISALGMAKISRAAWNYEEYRNVAMSESYKIGETNLTDEERIVHPTHMMYPEQSRFHYDAAIAGKTGYVDESLCTLVTYAKKNGRTLIAVVFRNVGEDTYKDTEKLFDYGFDNFKNVGMENGSVVTIPKDSIISELKTLVTGQEDAYELVDYKYNGVFVGKGKKHIEKPKAVKKSEIKKEKKAKKEKKDVDKTNKVNLLIKIFLAIALVLIIILLRINRIRRKKKLRRVRTVKKKRRNNPHRG